jgi:hypothetical protein
MTKVRVYPPKKNGTKPGDGLSTFTCTKCKGKIHIGVYAVAQMAMGYTLTHTHECGAKHQVAPGYKVTTVDEKAAA